MRFSSEACPEIDQGGRSSALVPTEPGAPVGLRASNYIVHGTNSALPVAAPLIAHQPCGMVAWGPSRSPSPPVLPYFFADQTGDPRLFLGHGDRLTLRCPACDFEYELGPDRLLEFIAVLDRHHKRTGPSNHAIFVV